MTPKAVAIGVALAVAGVLLGMNVNALWGGPYAFSPLGSNPPFIWRMNQRTGQVSLCLWAGTASDWKTGITAGELRKELSGQAAPRQTARTTPQCSPWGPVAEP